jgi:parallel beta-helix repeat protein
MSVKADPKTWIVDDDGPADFNNIQHAIINASSGDTILVRNGIYMENVVVNKSLSIIGENRDLTIIDGRKTTNVIVVQADFVTIKNFTIRNSGSINPYSGLRIDHNSNNAIVNNKIVDNYEGITLSFSNNNIITNNNMSNNYEGITLYQTANNIVSDNIIPSNVGDGIYLSYSNDNTISRNIISGNRIDGISAFSSSNNLIWGNTFSNNEEGMSLSVSANNAIFWNNFNNTFQVSSSSINTWVRDEMGNYWSSYSGTDADSDGVGDSSYIIDGNNRDNFPLMGMFYNFDIIEDATLFNVTVISNSTISNFGFEVGEEETGNKIIFYDLSATVGSTGFCRVSVPLELMTYPYIILVDGKDINATVLNVSDTENTWLYFTYPSETVKVRIISSKTMHLYIELLAKYVELQEHMNSLNISYQDFLVDYDVLFGNYTALLESFNALNASYLRYLQDYAAQHENMQSLMYIIAATAAVFMVTTVYLSRGNGSKGFPNTRKKEEE